MRLEDYKAGRYENQYEYKSFVPEGVAHRWIIADPELLILLGETDRAIGELNAFAQLVPDIHFFIRMYVAKEATQSSRIEGTRTNIEDAFKQEQDIAPETRDDWTEVQNYIRAVNFAIAELEKLPFSNRLMRQTHAILMQGVRGRHKNPGEFRRSQNWIGVSLKNAVFVPPHPDRVEDLMQDLERFHHNIGESGERLDVPPLIRVAIGHYQFETIHPFSDGNGRLGRLIISLFLASEKILVKPALYLSDYFERNKTAYVEHLMAVREGDRMRAWIIFFLYGLRETAQSSISVFRSILDLKERIERESLPRFSTRRQENCQQLMRHLYCRPVVDIKHVQELLDTTPNTASALVMDFVRFGILHENTGQRRNRLFVFKEYIDIFKGNEHDKT